MFGYGISVSVIFLLVLSVSLLFSQSADDYYHSGANSYINGKDREAKQTLTEGLQRYPNDPQLNSLLGKIKDEEDNKQKQEQKQEDEGQQGDDQQEQNQEASQEEQQQENEDQQEPQDAEQQQEQLGEPKEISKKDAERILNALKNEEEDLLKNKKTKKTKGAYRGKDW